MKLKQWQNIFQAIPSANSYCKSKIDYSWNPSRCICEYLWANTYLKSIADTSVIACDETDCTYKIDWYILHTVLLVIMLLLIITIICYHYAKDRSKQNGIDALTI